MDKKKDMFEVNRSLIVPSLSEVRNDLRKKVYSFVSRNKVRAPLPLASLEENAREILIRAGLSQMFLDFTIVLLGNEIWREHFSAVPYHRRLLLLPQCLRDRDNCKGFFDDLGFICDGCKSCRIDKILDKAEELGYTTLVAEGTTMAIGLVEEGAIDAVIGVSCMSVLKRSFESVGQAAIPGIGIPLLADGCENTTLDHEWLMEELEQYSLDTASKLLSISSLKHKVADFFQRPVLRSFFPGNNPAEQLALRMMEMGGQRMRPLMAILAYQAYTVDPQEEVQGKLAVLIECFHKASLVHDDIEDNEDFRYGHPALFRTDGIPEAINAGDFLIGKGYRLLAELPFDPLLVVECLKVVAASHERLSEGQGEDILLDTRLNEKSVNDIVQIFKLKTGEAIKVTLLSGAILGRAPACEKKYIERFSEYFGIAYQIRDDLDGYRKNAGNPFDFPFLLAVLKEKREKAGLPGLKLSDIKNPILLKEDLKKFDIENEAKNQLHVFLEKAYGEVLHLHNQKMRLALYGITRKVFKDPDREN